MNEIEPIKNSDTELKKKKIQKWSKVGWFFSGIA